MERGDGTGGSEKRQRNMPADQCIQHCLEKRRTSPGINGVTVGNGNNKCYCEINMNSRNSNAAWKNCKFIPKRKPEFSKYNIRYTLMSCCRLHSWS